MLRFKSIVLLAGIVALLTASTVIAAEPVHVTSFKSARKLAAKQELPILLKMGKEFCTSCSKFDQAVDEDDEFRDVIEKNVVLCVIDVRKGEGAELARRYHASDYPIPTFILTNSHGEEMDRWLGYWDSDNFVKHLTAAVENPITVDKRMARFQESPTEADARKLAELRDYQGLFAEAVAYFRRAQALNPDSETDYDLYVLSAMTQGEYDNIFTADEVKAQADRVVSTETCGATGYMKAAMSMAKVAKHTKDNSYYTPYLALAIEKTEGKEDDPKLLKGRVNLLPDYALYVEKDEDKAIALKKEFFAKAAGEEDWMTVANMLNNFAWWCFENEFNLDEAEELARQGIEFAKPGNQKANIFDTVAEICNLKGDCGDAVTLIRMAVAEDPENEYFQKQLGRFEELLRAQSD